jgi:trk system potassium uptake protein TrkH
MKLYLMIKTFLARHLTPTRIFVLSFAAAIFLGAILLRLPYAAAQNHLRFIDALFTSTSAVCVTGLTVLNIGKDLSFFGQVVTMFLFQVGGLGIITFSIVLFALMGRGIPLKGREITQSVFMYSPRKDFNLILKRVLLYTFVIESAGALILFFRFALEFSPGWALYHAVYHAVSAFNNCGYSLFSDNLIRYQGDVAVNLTIALLIILGGIGFLVQQEVVAWLRDRKSKLSLHTKIVLITTAALVLGGTILLYLLETDNVLQGASFKTALLASFFQSVTARTAGFNTVDIGMLTNSSILILLILMFIGASPGSTGGGVKTTSFALLVLLVANRVRGNENVNIANRTIPKELVERTISIIFSAAILIGIITAVLLFFSDSSGSPQALRHEFIEYVFETFSAFGTVGLSMGATQKLNDVQKYAVILMMFIGRVGPLTMAFAWYSSRKRKLTYAEESVMVG